MRTTLEFLRLAAIKSNIRFNIHFGLLADKTNRVVDAKEAGMKV